MVKDVKAMIMAAGVGSRLEPLIPGIWRNKLLADIKTTI